MKDGTVWSAGAWLRALEQPRGEFLRALRAVYGHHSGMVEERVPLLLAVARGYAERFGDGPMRVFRSPGRINLRGMHVDTHGGYLNLMTHQRETVLAAAPLEDDGIVLANLDPAFDEVRFSIGERASHPSFEGDWTDFITHPDIEGRVLAARGHWGHYAEGAVLRSQHHARSARRRGFRGLVGSSIPRGASLSSSSALTVAAMLAFLGCNGLDLCIDDLIGISKEAEWYTGARGGMSDQTAMLLGGSNELVNVALFPGEIDVSGARRCLFPEGLRVLVINSFTERSLSGAQLVEYTRNRFAYSLALEIARQELERGGMPRDCVAAIDRLPRLAPRMLSESGEPAAVYRLLSRIPGEIEIDELRTRYELPGLDALYHQYFGPVPEAARPASIDLRGPLLFGIAESERARVFMDTLLRGDSAYAGRLMSLGHDGDRRFTASGAHFAWDAGDDAMKRLAESQTPVHECPGVYGASSRALDMLVDAAMEGGALGASLTGAGIAGVVLALCTADKAEHVADVVRRRMSEEVYSRAANREIGPEELSEAVLVNHAPDGAGEIFPPGGASGGPA